ncbi:hypothetical protein LOZ48_005903 [Ophidiomyces ophidiicola]|nr:hypothetical protein LOZ48_005903 [Ophidiomyces ophidiicola]
MVLSDYKNHSFSSIPQSKPSNPHISNITYHSTMPSRRLNSFRLLSFDIYGTLIDWETGVLRALVPLTSRLPNSHPLKANSVALNTTYTAHERTIQATQPSLAYYRILKAAYESLAKELNALPEPIDGKSAEQLLDEESLAFAASIGSWPAFKDTVEAMHRLKNRGFKLVPLSNVDRESFSKTLRGPLASLNQYGFAGAAGSMFFDAAYTAQDIGSYKPDLRNFEYLIAHAKEKFGVEKKDILHVAQSIHYDHEPAQKIGLNSVWISRGEENISPMSGREEGYVNIFKIPFGWQFKTLRELADAVDAELPGSSA